MSATVGIIENARKSGRKYLNEIESKQLLKEAGVPTIDTRMARSRDEAIAFAEAIGFPVVLKIISPDIVHKSDIGGVKLGLDDAAAVSKAYDEILAAAKVVPLSPWQSTHLQKLPASNCHQSLLM